MLQEDNVISMRDIIKKYNEGLQNEIQVLNGINLDIKRGEFVSIVGQSGSGKSTLMNIIGILGRQTSGQYLLEGKDVNSLNDNERSIIRNEKIGFVFQNFNLIPRTTALKNVMIPIMYRKNRPKNAKEIAIEKLRIVGMEDRLTHKPNELSGGQKQRVAIARALVNEPSIILADEPTGALDTETGHMVMDLFHKLHEEQGKTIILITHSPELANETQRIITISDGKIIGEGIPEGRYNYLNVNHDLAGGEER